MSRDKNGASNNADDPIQEVAANLGILGFNPHTDAIKQRLYDGVRIWNQRDGEIRWCARTRDHQERWTSPTHSRPKDMQSALSAADGYEVIDKRLHNWLVSGPMKDVSGVHDGICWGIVLVFRSRLEDGDAPRAPSLRCIPGVGKKLSGRIASQLRSHSSYGRLQDA